MQGEAVRVERGTGAREVNAEVLLGAVREDVRDLVRFDGGLEERGRVGRVREVMDCPVGPGACGIGGRTWCIYPGTTLGAVGMVDAPFDRRGYKRAFEPEGSA